MPEKEHVDSVNPATEEILGSYPLHSQEQIEAILTEAQKTFLSLAQGEFFHTLRIDEACGGLFAPEQEEIRNSHNAGNGKTDYGICR